MLAADVQEALAEVADARHAAVLRGFFKTGPGEYGEGDVFIGVRLPDARGVAKRFSGIALDEVETLLDSAVHEHRLCALLILVARYDGDASERPMIVERYLAAVYSGRVNNWDLVDTSASSILGRWLVDKDHTLLFDLASSDSLWERRVAVIATQAFIRAGDASTTLALAKRLLPDRTDLIQKAVGWTLRDVGKRVDRSVLTGFLDRHAAAMGRTALSYATEHLSPAERAHYRALR